MTPPAIRLTLAAAVIALAVSLPTGESRSESDFFTTVRPVTPTNTASRGSGEADGMLARLRKAMGLDPEPSAPMQLVPDKPRTEPGPVVDAMPRETYADIFAPPSEDPVAPRDEFSGEQPPDISLRRPPPRPLVSIVDASEPRSGSLSASAGPLPADDPAAEPGPPRQAETSTAPARIAVATPVPAPRETPPERPLLAGSAPPVPALPPRNPKRSSASARVGDSAATGGDEPQTARLPPLLASNDAESDEVDPSPSGANETPDGMTSRTDGKAVAPSVEDASPSVSAAAPPTANTGAGENSAPDHAATRKPATAGDVEPGRGQPTGEAHADADSAPVEAHGGNDAHEPDGDEPGESEKAEAEPKQLPPPPPSELPALMRVMSALQDDIARGSGSALAAQRIMSRRVAEEIAANSDRTLAVPATARALLHYALTGGSPPDVRAAVDRVTFEPPYDHLLPGALAFLEGRQNDARRHFDAVDMESLSAVTAGPVRLALAALTLEEDPVKALDHLDWARHSAPGTLVEEAALRRAVLLTAERNMIDRFEQLTSRYLRKFRRSAYAGNFRRRLASALTRMRFLDQPDGFERLVAILEPMSLEGRREIYLDIARSAVEGGRSGVAAAAARLSRESAPADSLDAARAELYAAAADVVDPGRTDAAVAALDTMDVTPLPEGDRVLREAALRLGQAVTTLPDPQSPAPDQPGVAVDPAAAGAAGPSPPGLPPVVAGDPIGRLDPALLQAVATAPVTQEADDEPSEIETRVNSTLAEIDALLRNSP